MTLKYRLHFEPDDNGTILATSPDIPLVTYGEDEEAARRHAEDAAEAILASMMDHREDIPAPVLAPDESGPILRLSLQTTLKVALYIAMREAGLNRAELQRRLGWQRESVDRLFRLDHQSRIEQLDEAFRALGKEVEISLPPAAA